MSPSVALAHLLHPPSFKVASSHSTFGAGASSQAFESALHYLPAAHTGSQAVHSYLKYVAAVVP